MRTTSTAVENGSAGIHRLEVGDFCVTDVVFPPQLVLPSHFHPRACLAVILEGSLEKTFSSGSRALQAPAAVTMPPEERHVDRFERAGAHILVIEPACARDATFGSGASLFERVEEIRDGAVQSLAWRIRSELMGPDDLTPLAVDGLVRELVVAAARNGRAREPRRPPRWFGAAEELLRARFAEPLRLDDVARETGVHPAHLARVFRIHHGTSLGSYVRRLRLEWASRQLVAGDLPLCDIAVQAGFADQAHFTRAFREYAGVPPGRFRRVARHVTPGPARDLLAHSRAPRGR